MKKTQLLFFILFSALGISQNSVELSYYYNEKRVKLENLAVSIATENDTINLKTTKTKIKFPTIEKAFTLLINTNGDNLCLG